MERADHELLSALQQGDEHAVEELLQRYQGRIYRYGMKMCRNPEDAKDVLQETLLAMAKSVRTFRGASSLSTWLYTIARNICIKKRRRSKFAPAAELSLSHVDCDYSGPANSPSERPDQLYSVKEMGARLNAAVESLEPAYRDVLLLRDVEGLSAAEVAEVLGIRVDAVKSRLHRARLAVRNHMVPLLGISARTRALPAAPCPDVTSLFSRHLEGEVGPDICRSMELHLAECPECRRDCDAMKQNLALCRSSDLSVPDSAQKSVRDAIRIVLKQHKLPGALQS